MLLDALNSQIPLDRSADIAIVGSGPAGITLARQLERNFDVLLLEAGATDITQDSAACLAGEIDGIAYDLTATRARVFGGSTALWAGYCAVFDPLDFAARTWIPGSGWPIEPNEVFAHIADAARLLHVEDACFDADAFAGETGCASMQPDREKFQLSVWRFGRPKADFGNEYREALARSSSIHVLTNACVTDIHLRASGGTVEYMTIKTLGGRTGTVRARIFIVAAGGIETPRLMLASNRQEIGGVGNSSGHVGRWFMEHPHICVTGLEIQDSPGIMSWTGRSQSDDGRVFTFCTGATAQQQTRQEILNARAHLFRTPSMAETAPPRLGVFFEQAPNAASRITLSKDIDPFGLPKVRLDWQLSALDYRSHRVLGAALAEDFLRRRIARQQGRVGVADEVLFSNHQLGTTRMSSNPADGVVDRDCRVHGIDNLFIAGGSVFPTVSWANPTITVLALTLRLAHHIGNVLAAV